MGMSEFIKNNQEPIVAEWESFARSIPSAEHLDQKALRNQTFDLLTFIAEDMNSSQTALQQSEKAKGKGVKQAPAEGRAAKNHAEERFLEGFDVVQLMSEFRALRASVTRLLDERQGMSDASRELNRFHESIDQLLMESLVQYNSSLNRRRDLFLGMLIHDMRNPLSAISNAAQLLPMKGQLNETQAKLAAQIARNTSDIVKLVSELVDVTRSTLGKGIPVSPEPMDMADNLQHAVQQAKMGNPSRNIALDIKGDMRGKWDAARIGQLLSNLICNALKHGASDSSVKITAKEEGSGLTLSVHNEGEPIPADLLPTIFDAMVRGTSMKQTQSESSSLGLGLFISKEIVTAHGGKIYATSTKGDGTTFVVWLPRKVEARQKRN